VLLQSMDGIIYTPTSETDEERTPIGREGEGRE
jgi:hypothetical protein